MRHLPIRKSEYIISLGRNFVMEITITILICVLSLFLQVVAISGSSMPVEHPSADQMKLGGGGGIRNHNGQHVSIFDSLCVEVVSRNSSHILLPRWLPLVCAVVGSLVRYTSCCSNKAFSYQTTKTVCISTLIVSET